MASQESVIDWLLAGDSAIRWQVMRDLLDELAEARHGQSVEHAASAPYPPAPRPV
jgi:hypothetical protein